MTRTSKFRLGSIVLYILSFLLNVAPLFTYVIIALSKAELTHQKITLTMTVLVVLILSLISWANKIVLRSKLWILLIGLYICLKSIMTPLVIIAICQVLDELIISPLKHSYKTKFNINKELDARL